MNPQHPSINPECLVFGSLNLDLVATTPRLPQPGETITGDRFSMVPGGKGANQAVAAARLGVATAIVGRVGGDNFAEILVESLQSAEVQTDRLLKDPAIGSGVAMITVEQSGENTIAVIPGANGRVDETDVDRLAEVLPTAKVLLLQLEIPLAAVEAAARRAKQAGVTVILDPAPARSDLPDSLYPLLDWITPNETEASQLTGIRVHDVEAARQAAMELCRRGVGRAIVKLGAKGVVCCSKDETIAIPAFPVEAVDTVAAGDAFNGAIAAAIVRGFSLQETLIYGAAAGALSATKAGAQPSLPDRPTLEAFLKASRGKD
ncbi:MAG: ribokinase [Cyanobacteria bacterium J007]|nr:MAG: ribokinase [Cyanobacteria bacterium J007]